MVGEAAHITCHNDFTITNYGGNQDFIRHLALMEAFEPAGGAGNGFTLTDESRYVCVRVCVCLRFTYAEREKAAGGKVKRQACSKAGSQ